MAGAQRQRVRRERGAESSNSDAKSAVSSHPDASTASNSASHRDSAASSSSGPLALSRPSPPRFDGNRDPEGMRDPDTQAVIVNPRNLDLGMGAWETVRGSVVTELPRRPVKMSALGREINVGLNTFSVERLPSKPVYQFDVLLGNGAEKRGLITALWNSRAVQSALPNARGWIFDGNKLAWSLDEVQRELRITVDLDAERCRPTKPGGRENKHRVIIRQTNVVRFGSLDGFLAGQSSFTNSCLEAITFLDHLLRESPSKKYTQIKRSFFAKGQQRFSLGGGVEAFAGVYQSIRIAHRIGGQAGLSVNLDVANGMFWSEGLLQRTIMALTGARSEAEIGQRLRDQNGRDSPGWKAISKLRRLRVVAAHRSGADDDYVIEKFIKQSAKEHKFEVNDKQTGQKKWMTIYDYFQQKYNLRLSYPDWPLVKMTKKGTVLPIEVLKLKENQRLNGKTDERQTAQMIKFAVTPPAQRWGSVEHGLRMLDWKNDPYLKNYGLQISTQKTTVKARLLQNPKVQFANGSNDPRTSGRWDLKGKRFLTGNPKPLKSWGVCIIAGRGGADKATVEKFISEFIKIYTLHGGQVTNKQPAMHLASGPDVGKAVEEVWNKAGNQSQARPQMLMFILPDKDSQVYGRIKKSCECRYGVVSQCVQYAHVQKCTGQYISNVCMKFNAKLGGVTARAIGPKTGGPNGIFEAPTLIIGADVSHAPPGMPGASMAAMTVSMDKLATRYAAAVNTNGYRVEMITTENIEKMLKPLLQEWVRSVGGGRFPALIYYFRDGVSEGQFRHVLDQEIRDIKNLFKQANPSLNIPFVVMVGSKRHHVRFFPPGGDAADRNGNALPGTLVETGVTHPFENDFYLCAHAALKGTARPMHYHMLANEAKIPNDVLQTMIYEHSYQYIRATTPVSQFPAIYYAHIASNRAGSHDRNFGGSNERVTTGSGRSGSQSGNISRGQTSSDDRVPTEFPDLLPMPNTDGINSSMWYI
ncbi:Protein argonaute [Taxawa tesnikishii (nom. ined.)]|nr:Protein argonaute [Dothideales sp. JES 119]